MFFCSRQSVSQPETQWSQTPQAQPSHGIATRSPTATSVTAAPVSTTMPTPSCPGINGGDGLAGQSPCAAWMSVWHRPVASTLTRTCPGSSAGGGTCSTVSGLWKSWTTAALYVPMGAWDGSDCTAGVDMTTLCSLAGLNRRFSASEREVPSGVRTGRVRETTRDRRRRAGLPGGGRPVAEWVTSRPREGSAGAPRAQQGHCRLVGELLAGHAGDETPTPDQAPGLEAAKGPEDLPPCNGQPFLEVDVAEHHAPSQQELPRDGLGQLLDVLDRLRFGQQRPAALHALRPCAPPVAEPRARVRTLAAGEPGAGLQERADGVEPVGADEPAGHAVPQAFLDLGGNALGDGLQVGVEQGAVPAQGVEHLPPAAVGGLGRRHGPALGLQEPGQILAKHEGDRRPARRSLDRAARLPGPGIVTIGGRLEDGQPAPCHLARKAQLVEPLGTVGLDPLGEDPLPLPGRELEA